MRPLLLVLAALFFPSVALACLWDYDTLLQERSRFPDALELITGKFLRHSQEFYYWRITDRTAKLAKEPDNLAFIDDLAVACDRIGDHRKAIELMLAAQKKQPGRYETEANLGTFYIHAGQWEKGLTHIDKALGINPNAHFGREKYQRLLVEFMIQCRQDGKLRLPLSQAPNPEPIGGFHDFIARKLWANSASQEEGLKARQEAIKGILGIMRFGNFESPVVLEALASLLSKHRGFASFDNRSQDAKQLAARALLKASYVASEEANSAYREMATSMVSLQVGMNLEELEASFKQELKEAHEWYEKVRQDELTWIKEDKNPEEEFTRKYYQEPQLSTSWSDYIPNQSPMTLVAAGIIGVVVLVFGRRCYRRPAAGIAPTTKT